MWIWSKCEARVDPSFDVCWRCGTSYQGEEDPDFVTADESPAIGDLTDYLRLEAGKPSDPEIAEPPLDLAPCFESNDLAEAQFVADELVGEGIPATLQNAFNVGIPSGTYSLYPCTVVVRAEDQPRARSWVDEHRGRGKSRVRRSE
jgi:hypothetical protein